MKSQLVNCCCCVLNVTPTERPLMVRGIENVRWKVMKSIISQRDKHLEKSNNKAEWTGISKSCVVMTKQKQRYNKKNQKKKRNKHDDDESNKMEKITWK